MSYILEALKKSSEERARLASGPAIPDVIPHAAGNRRIVFLSSRWFFVAVMVVAAGIALMLGAGHQVRRFGGNASQEPPLVADAAAGGKAVAVPGARAYVRAAPVEKTLAKQEVVPSVEEAKAANHAEQRAPKPVEKAPPAAPKPVSAVVAEPEPKPARPLPVADNPSPAPPTAPEMPPELAKQIQAMPISAHVYSNRPADRMVILDGRAMREGDTLPSGLVVEQITASGMTLNYKGIRTNKAVFH
ncbi:general secretion pathway protein GspB [Propionivibrio limicola]|uniref:general secretion pathway protein GspB n=1 Tax=Propionivibrio limicola TaxID=167645 RepID=UPI001291B350|nr:general secretion pathway protein GspB [Propionivibrio limicola]